MNQSHQESRMARRHSWQPIQDGDQASHEDSKDRNNNLGKGPDCIEVNEEQEKHDASTRTGAGQCIDEHHDDQSAVLQQWQNHTVADSTADIHAPRPNQTTSRGPNQLSIGDLLFSNNQRGAYDYRRRITEGPKVAPSRDPTIAVVEKNREQHIVEMLNAIYDLSNVLDKPDGRECKMFARHPTLAEYAKPRLVEAACRTVFQFLIDRCKNGFRGHEKDNHALKPALGREADRDGSCATRLCNILMVLRTSKCACRDILNEDYKIILLVNHPLYFLKKKNECRRNNEHKKKVNMEGKKALLAQQTHDGSPKEGSLGADPLLAVVSPRDIQDENGDLESRQHSGSIAPLSSKEAHPQPKQDQNHQVEQGFLDGVFKERSGGADIPFQETNSALYTFQASLGIHHSQHGSKDWLSHSAVDDLGFPAHLDGYDDGNSPPPDFFSEAVIQHQHRSDPCSDYDATIDVSAIDPALQPPQETIVVGTKRRSSSSVAGGKWPAKVMKM